MILLKFLITLFFIDFSDSKKKLTLKTNITKVEVINNMSLFCMIYEPMRKKKFYHLFATDILFYKK